MDNLHVSKETIVINKNQASSSTESVELLFLKDSAQIVCNHCYQQNFKGQHSTVFKDKATCQSISSACTSVTKQNFKIMVEYLDSGEIKKECLLCTQTSFLLDSDTQTPIEIKEIAVVQEEHPHTCTRTWEEAFSDGSKQTILDRFIPLFSPGDQDSFSDSLREINEHSSKNISGCWVSIERFASSLCEKWTVAKLKERGEQEDFSFLHLVVETEIPWINTSHSFLLLINLKYKHMLLRRAKNKLISLLDTDSESEIDNCLIELFKLTTNTFHKSIICLLMSENAKIELLKEYFFTDTDCPYYARPLFQNLIVEEMINKRNELASIFPKKTNEDYETYLFDDIMFENIVNATFFKNFSLTLPTYNLDTDLKNEHEIVSNAHKITYLTSQLIFRDIPITQSLTQIQNSLSNLSMLISLKGSIDHEEGTSSRLSQDQKAKLFYSTPLVNTILQTVQILREECIKTNHTYPQFKPIFTSLLSIMLELGRDCFDISMFWFTNLHTFIDLEVKTQVDLLNFKTFKFLFDFKTEYEFKEILIDLNKGILFYKTLEKYKQTKEFIEEKEYYSKEYAISVKMAEFDQYLLRKFYSDESNENGEFDEVLKETDISLNTAMEYYFIPIIDMNRRHWKELMNEQRQDKRIEITYPQAKKILEDQAIEESYKLKLISYYMTQNSSIQEREQQYFVTYFSRVCNPVLNTPINILVKLDYDKLIANLKTYLNNESSQILKEYFEKVKQFITSDNSLLDKLNIFSEASYVFFLTKEEIEAYNLDYNIDFEFVFEELLKSSEIELNPSAENLLVERIFKLKKGYKLILKDKEELRKYLTYIQTNFFVQLKLPIDQKMYELDSYSWLVDLSEDDIFESLVDDTTSFENKSLPEISMIATLLSKFDLKGKKLNEISVKAYLKRLTANLVYFLNLFKILSELKAFADFALFIFNNILKILHLYRKIVDSDNMQIRRSITDEKFDYKLEVTLNNNLKISNIKKPNITLFLILLDELTKCVEFFDENTCKLPKHENVELNLLSTMLGLICEILEGNSENKELYGLWEPLSNRLEQDQTDENTAKREVMEDFLIKLYFDPTIDQEAKGTIKSLLQDPSLVKRVLSLKNVDFVRETLESNSNNKTETLVSLYYSDRNTSLEDFNKIFLIFTYLKFEIDYDFTQEHDLKHIGGMLTILTKKVEVDIEKKMAEVYFLPDPDTHLLTQSDIEIFSNNVDRSSITAKNKDTLNYALHYKDEIAYMKQHLKSTWRRFGYRISTKWLTVLSLMITVGTMFLMLNHTNVVSKQIEESSKAGLTSLLVAQIAISLFVLFLWITLHFQSLYSLSLMRYRVNNNIEKGNHTTRDMFYCRLITFYSSLEFSCAFVVILTDIIAISFDSLYWVVSLQLLCFIGFSTNLLNIIKAIQLRSKQLGLISVFLVLLLFISGLLTFNYMSESFQTEDGDMLCLTLGHCLASQLDFGFRMGGGMGDNMPVQEWDTELFWRKFVYSMSHFILFPVIMLNVVAGIIIDTFADLREQAAELEKDKTEVCLICGNSMGDIQKEEGSYKRHVEEKHAPLSYMLFIKYVLEKEGDKLNYCETYVRRQIEKNMIDWFPVSEDGLEDKIDKLRAEMNNNFKAIAEAIEKKQSNKKESAKVEINEDEVESKIIKELVEEMPEIAEYVEDSETKMFFAK